MRTETNFPEQTQKSNTQEIGKYNTDVHTSTCIFFFKNISTIHQ